MPPKVDPNEVKYVGLRCIGGEEAGASVLGAKLGPLGLN